MWFKYPSLTTIIMMGLVIIILLFIINVSMGNQGSYTNHWPFMVDLWNKSVKIKPSSNCSKGEQECRRVVEQFTGLPFPRTRPSFLYNTISGHVLELDCFNPTLKLAIEYNGEQHYKFIPHFHGNRDAFTNMQYRDAMKKQLCHDHGIDLIIVPYTVKHEDIETYLSSRLSKYKKM